MEFRTSEVKACLCDHHHSAGDMHITSSYELVQQKLIERFKKSDLNKKKSYLNKKKSDFFILKKSRFFPTLAEYFCCSIHTFKCWFLRDAGMLDSAAGFHASRSSIRTTCPTHRCRHKTASCRVCRVMHRLTTRQRRTRRTAAARMYYFLMHGCLSLAP